MRLASIVPPALGLLLLPACSITTETGVRQPAARRTLNLPGRSDARPFSHVVVAGNTVYVAGTIGLDPATGQPPADAAAEARLALDSVRAKLALAGLTMDDLVSVQVFCPDLSLYDTFNKVYGRYFRRHFPVRAFIGSGPLLRNGRFEINGIAVKRSND